MVAYAGDYFGVANNVGIWVAIRRREPCRLVMFSLAQTPCTLTSFPFFDGWNVLKSCVLYSKSHRLDRIRLRVHIKELNLSR